MKNQKILYFILLSTILAWAGCSNSTDDYWKMRDPSLVVVDETGLSQIFHNPKSLHLKNTTLNYGSHLSFSDINKDVTFDISTKCLLNNKTFTSNYTQQKIYQKLFFYNFIPLQTIATDRNTENQEFKCDIHIIAKNSINSKIKYDLPDLTFNTIQPNGILIGKSLSDAADASRGIYIKNGFIDTTETNDKHTTAILMDDARSFYNTNVICENNIFIKEDQEHISIRKFSINEFFHRPKINSRYFYKKCRVISSTTQLVDIFNESILENDYERLWSPYFDVIVNKPELSITAEFINTTNDYFADNNQSYSFNFAKLTLRNNSFISALIKLRNPIDAQVAVVFDGRINPYTLNRNMLPKTNGIIKESLPDAILKGTLSTKLKFVPEHQDSKGLISLSGEETSTVFLQLEKNFSCSIYNKEEMGLLLKAITPYSEEDKIEVYVVINNKLEKFPMPYYISEAMVPSSLNMIQSSKYVFDSLLLPRLNSTSFKDAEDHDTVYRRKVHRGIIKNEYLGSMNQYYSFLFPSFSHSKFCRTYPSDSSVSN
ncbi:MAG: hypothetical protein M9899_05330 [Bdellovibrionaceae bacterium]|nr:hypothetical protein [Pseudobdellovibrionaceae bacterium]